MVRLENPHLPLYSALARLEVPYSGRAGQQLVELQCKIQSITKAEGWSLTSCEPKLSQPAMLSLDSGLTYLCQFGCKLPENSSLIAVQGHLYTQHCAEELKLWGIDRQHLRSAAAQCNSEESKAIEGGQH